jgi:uncharacterized protein YuzE
MPLPSERRDTTAALGCIQVTGSNKRRHGRANVQILYDVGKDLLYIRLDDQKQTVINRRVSEDMVLDMGEEDRIVGIEILDASKHLSLERLLPVQYQIQVAA